jgi:hypothetical protein
MEVDTTTYFRQVARTCEKQCIKSFNLYTEDIAEKSCLHRCAYKFRDAYSFGQESLKQLKI